MFYSLLQCAVCLIKLGKLTYVGLSRISNELLIFAYSFLFLISLLMPRKPCKVAAQKQPQSYYFSKPDFDLFVTFTLSHELKKLNCPPFMGLM